MTPLNNKLRIIGLIARKMLIHAFSHILSKHYLRVTFLPFKSIILLISEAYYTNQNSSILNDFYVT